MKIKKNDIVVVLRGKDKGKTGTVIKSIPTEQKVIVEGVHMIKKIKRATTRNEKSTVVEMAYPIPVSVVALLDKETNKPTRIGHTVTDGKKVRIARSSKSIIS